MDNAETKVISLSDEVERLEGKIEDIFDEVEDLDQDSEEFEEADAKFKALSIQKEKYEDAINGDSSFKIRELSFGQLMSVRDEVMSLSDEDSPREGLYKIRTLEEAVVDTPVDVENDPKEWKPVVAEWVYDEVDAMNSGVSEENIANFSLAEEMEKR